MIKYLLRLNFFKIELDTLHRLNLHVCMPSLACELVIQFLNWYDPKVKFYVFEYLFLN